MAVMRSADIGATEDTLSESPSENGARDDITEDVANRARHHPASLPCAPRQGRPRPGEGGGRPAHGGAGGGGRGATTRRVRENRTRATQRESRRPLRATATPHPPS